MQENEFLSHLLCDILLRLPNEANTMNNPGYFTILMAFGWFNLSSFVCVYEVLEFS